MSLPTHWRVAVAVTNAVAPAYEAALETDAVAISIYERETGTPPRSAPEPATWDGDVYMADACIVEAIFTDRPNRDILESAVAIAAAASDDATPKLIIEAVEDADWAAKVLESLPPIRVSRFLRLMCSPLLPRKAGFPHR